TASNSVRRLFARPSRVSVERGKPKARPAARPALELLEDRWTPAVLTVNSLADNITDTSHLTLREAVSLVNNLGDPAPPRPSRLPSGWSSQISGAFDRNGDTIQFDPGLLNQNAGSGLGVISLKKVDDHGAGPSALAINALHKLTIAGPTTGNAGITIERAPDAAAMRLFAVRGSLTLENLTLAGGDAVGGYGGGNAAATGGGAAGLGGAVFVDV